MSAITSPIPAFDRTSADERILAGFERVRLARAYMYGFDGSPDSEQHAREVEFNLLDKLMIEDEAKVRDGVAVTLPGVAARLMLLIPSVDQARWVDRGLMEHGLLALCREVDSLDGNAQQLAHAAHELIAIEWQQNLAAYEKSATDFEAVLRLKGLVDTERFRRRDADLEACAFLDGTEALADALEDRFSNDAFVQRLVRTLVPDHAAYLRKVEIIIAEGYQEDATPWLARDTNHLVGRIEAGEPTGEAH